MGIGRGVWVGWRHGLFGLLVAGLALIPPAVPAAPGAPVARRTPTEILFQAFTWDAAVDGKKHVWYRHLEAVAPQLRRAGMTHVWFPPVSRSVGPQGYMPGDLYDLGEGDELGDNRTLYGNRAELVSAVRAMKRLGMMPLCDAVLNHRCASHQEDGIWNVFHHRSGKARWERWALAKDDYRGTGAADSGEDFGAAPDLDHANPRVQADLVEWLRWMRTEIGFDGIRFDFTKGYAPQYARHYAEASGSRFSVGEYWTSMGYDGDKLLPNQDGHRQALADWVDGTGGKISTFDFTTKGLLQEACRTRRFDWLRGRDGRAAGFLGWWPGRAVTFLDNHDTGSTQAHWPFPSERVLEGYAYLLTHPGMPSVFWDHMFSWGGEVRGAIEAMCRLRHEAGLHRESKLEILEARHELYAARIDGKVAMKLGAADWSPGSGWTLQLSGHQYAIWTR